MISMNISKKESGSKKKQEKMINLMIRKKNPIHTHTHNQTHSITHTLTQISFTPALNKHKNHLNELSELLQFLYSVKPKQQEKRNKI